MKKIFKWKKIDTFYSIVLFSMLGMMGLWLMDIGASMGNLSCLKTLGIKLYAQSLFFKFEDYQIYHIGLLCVVISIFVLSYIAMKKSLEVETNNKKSRRGG